MVFRTSSSRGSPARQFEGFCLCRWTAVEDKLWRYQVPSLGKLVQINGAFVEGFGYRSAGILCEPLYKRARQVGFWPPAERLKDFRGWSAQTVARGNRFVEGCPKRGNPIKISFSNLRFESFLGIHVIPWERQAKIKLISSWVLKKMKMKNGVMGSSRPFAQKKNV